MARAHLYLPITSASGDVLEGITVRLLQPGTLVPITDIIYSGVSGSGAYTPPYVVPNGVINVYLDTPRRVRLGVTPPGQAEFFLEDVDIHGEAGVGNTNLLPRATAIYTTATLAAGAHEEGTIALAKSYRLMRVQTSAPARVRLYTTAAKRTADLARAAGTDPIGDSGVVLDYVTTSSIGTASPAHTSPQVVGSNLEATPTTAIPITVTPTSAGAITVTLTYASLES